MYMIEEKYKSGLVIVNHYMVFDTIALAKRYIERHRLPEVSYQIIAVTHVTEDNIGALNA